MVVKDGFATQVGIFRFSENRTTCGGPSVIYSYYTRVSAVVNWLESLAPLESPPAPPADPPKPQWPPWPPSPPDWRRNQTFVLDGAPDARELKHLHLIYVVIAVLAAIMVAVIAFWPCLYDLTHRIFIKPAMPHSAQGVSIRIGES